MLRVLLVAVVLVVTTCGVCRAEEKYIENAFWLTGSYNKHAGAGFGIRNRYFGVEFSYVDRSDFTGDEVNNYSPGMVSLLNLHKNSVSLGEKVVDPTYGIDFALYLNPTRFLSLYGEAGPYYEEKREINEDLESGKFWSEGNTKKLLLGGGGGLQFKLPIVDWGIIDGILVGAGYHSIKGINIQLGLTY